MLLSLCYISIFPQEDICDLARKNEVLEEQGGKLAACVGKGLLCLLLGTLAVLCAELVGSHLPLV